MAVCYAYPGYLSPPTSQKCTTIDEEHGSGWGRTIIGSSPQKPREVYATVRDSLKGVDFVVPASEEGVLVAGYLNDALRLPGLSLAAALNCTYRARQRAMIQLACPELNPEWDVLDRSFEVEPWLGRDVIVKSPASTYGFGVEKVHVLSKDDLECSGWRVLRGAYKEVARLSRCLLERTYCSVEEYLPDSQWEVSAIVGRGGIIRHVFPTLEQEWSNGRILRYRVCDGKNPVPILEKVIAALGVQNCALNLEMRGDKLIEAQARLGEEVGDEYDRLHVTSGTRADKLIEVLGG